MRNGLLAQIRLDTALDAKAGQLICICGNVLPFGPQRQQGEKEREAGAGGDRNRVELDAPRPAIEVDVDGRAARQGSEARCSPCEPPAARAVGRRAARPSWAGAGPAPSAARRELERVQLRRIRAHVVARLDGARRRRASIVRWRFLHFVGYRLFAAVCDRRQCGSRRGHASLRRPILRRRAGALHRATPAVLLRRLGWVADLPAFLVAILDLPRVAGLLGVVVADLLGNGAAFLLGHRRADILHLPGALLLRRSGLIGSVGLACVRRSGAPGNTAAIGGAIRLLVGSRRIGAVWPADPLVGLLLLLRCRLSMGLVAADGTERPRLP